jgi:hypothetical protein
MLAGAGCESAEAKQCRAQYLATHALVPGIDVDNFESVEKGLEAVQQTTEVCRKANLREELEQLQKVRDQLQSHLDYLHTHGQPRELNADELAQLVEHGDPSCPNGQAYKPKQSEEQIRCTGPKLAFMNFEQARAFYSGRGFKIHAEDGQLKAEYGSESYTYHFASPNDENPARCIEVFAAPGISWQESVSRLTGVAPFRLKEGQPVKTPKGELALQHTKDDTQAIYRLGHCD